MAQLRKNLFPSLAIIRMKSTVRCPDCQGWMQPFSCQNVIVDKCPQCQGIWFDAHELGIFRDTLQGYDLGQLKMAEAEESDRAVIRTCPRCRVVLDSFTYSYNSNVKLFRCERCSGIWTPFKELIHLVEFVKMSQLIAADSRGFAVELLAHHARVERWKNIRRFGEEMQRPLRMGWLNRRGGIILPLRTNQAMSDQTYSTFGLLFINVLFFVRFRSDEIRFALMPARISSGHDLERLITSMFVHTGFVSFFGSLFFLWLFGTAVETVVGWRKFFVSYLAVGVAANLVTVASDPHSEFLVLGSGAAVSGVLGAYLRFFPNATVSTFLGSTIVDVPAWIYLGGWFLIQFLWAVTAHGSGLPGLNWNAHLAGFFFGLLLAKPRRPI